MRTPPGLVIQLGSSPAAAATYVSRRRGWRHEAVDTVDQVGRLIEAGPCSTLLVALDGDSTSSETFLTLAEAAARAPGDVALGFLHGFGADALHRAAQRFPATAATAPSDGAQRAFAMPDFAECIAGTRLASRAPLDAGQAPHTSDAPDDVPARPETAELLSPAELLFLLGHGNGEDAGAGRFVLCRRATSIDAVEELDVLPCFRGAPCRFQERPVTIVCSDDLQARRLVALVCWGVSVASQPFAPDSTVGAGFLGRSRAETVLTLVRAAPIVRADYLALYYACNDGVPLGAAATRANRARLARGQRADIICFGDPESRLTPSIVPLPAEVVNRALRLHLHPSSVPSTAGRVDVRVEAAACIHGLKAPALVFDGAMPEAAALMPDGTLYLTLDAGVHMASGALAVSAVESESLADDRSSLRAMTDDVESVRQLLSALSRWFAGDRSDIWPCITDTAGHAAELETTLLHWPLAVVEPATMLSTLDIAQAREHRETRLTGLRESLLTLWEACLVARIPMLQALDRSTRIVNEAAAASHCAYCRQRVDLQVRRDLFDRIRRYSAFCRACGHVYNGPEPDVWVECGSPVRAGDSAPVSIVVRHRYAWPVSAQCSLGLLPFGSCAADPPVRSSAEDLPAAPASAASAPRTLRGTLSIPGNAPTGRHELFGCVVVGAAVTFVRRWITVSSGAGASPSAPPDSPR